MIKKNAKMTCIAEHTMSLCRSERPNLITLRINRMKVHIHVIITVQSLRQESRVSEVLMFT